MADNEKTNDPAGPGWWKTKAGWEHWNRSLPGDASPWPQLAIGVVIGVVALLIAGWNAWPLAAALVLMGSVGLLPRRVYWSLAGLLLVATVTFWAITD
jgi:hypothetical protein